MSDNNPFCDVSFFSNFAAESLEAKILEKKKCRNNGGLSEGQQKHSYKLMN
jgi:hypothetical protein